MRLPPSRQHQVIQRRRLDIVNWMATIVGGYAGWGRRYGRAPRSQGTNMKHLLLSCTVLLLLFAAAMLSVAASAQEDGANETTTPEYTFRESTSPKAALADELGAEYIGAASCLMCHEGMKDKYLGTLHALSLGRKYALPVEVGCEACHGPGSVHAEIMGDNEDARWPALVRYAGAKRSYRQFAVCLDCHRKTRTVKDWGGSVHGLAKVGCTTCHDPHERTKYAHQIVSKQPELCAGCHSHVVQVFRGPSHHPVLDESRACTQCHNPHGANEALAWTENRWEACGRCHSSATGPFIYPHLSADSDLGDGGCGACHEAHGSANHAQLKISGNGLCLQCHTDRANHKPGRTCWTAGCHSQVHGSNQNLLLLR